jgi:hypothetical protein
MYTEFQSKSLKGRDRFGDVSVYRGVIFKRMLRKEDVSVLTGFFWFGMGYIRGSCHHDNKLLGSIKHREFLDYLGSCWLLRGIALRNQAKLT